MKTINCIILFFSIFFAALFISCQPPVNVGVYSDPAKIAFPEYKYNPPKPLDYRDTLKNGIVVYVVESHRLPVFDITAIVRTGSIFDPDSLVGLADMTAKLMRTGGTKSFTGDKVDERIEYLSASLGCSMSVTSATAYLSILKKDMDEGLNMFSEMLKSPRFAEDKLALEKKQVYEAIAHRWDNPRNVLTAGFSKSFYNSFPAGRLSTKNTVKSISRKDLIRFHKNFFRPQNILLAVSGDFNKGEMIKKLDSLFGSWQDNMKKPAEIPEWDKNIPKGKIIFVEKKANQTFIRMGHPCIQRPDPDYYPLSVFNYILGGGGFMSRLTKRIRSDEGLAYDVRSSVESNYFYTGAFTITLQTKSKSSAYAIKLCLEELRKALDKKPVTQEELEIAQKSLTESLPAMFSSAKDIAENFCLNEFWGRSFDHFDVYREKINALTPDDLQKAALRHLSPDSLMIFAVGDLKTCEKGDGEHAVKLSDIGKIETIDVKSLEK